MDHPTPNFQYYRLGIFVVSVIVKSLNIEYLACSKQEVCSPVADYMLTLAYKHSKNLRLPVQGDGRTAEPLSSA